MPQLKYGLSFPDNIDPRIIELGFYSNDRWRNAPKATPLSRWEHLRACMKGFLPDNVFRWHRWVDDFGEAWCEHTGIAVWGAGGTTKSGIVGALALFDLMAEPNNTLTVMVTNPQEKHWDRCFSKTLWWKAKLPEPWKSMWKVVKSPKPSLLTLDSADGSRRGILCISIDKGESGADIAKKVGAHAPRTRLILDEGQGLPEDALGIGVNLFMGSTDKKGVVIGNPSTWRNNALGAASLPMDGDTRRIDDEKPDSWPSAWSWDTKPGVTLVFDGMRSPTMESPEMAAKLEGIMIQPRDIERLRSMPGGENSLFFWSQARGRIPPAGTGLTLMSELDWDTCGVATPRLLKGKYELGIGTDLSLGGDKVPVYIFGIGQVENVGIAAVKKDRKYIMVDLTKPDRSGQIAKQFCDILDGINKSPMVPHHGHIGLHQCALECSGQQGAIADRIEDVWNKRRPGLPPQYAVRIRTEEGVSDRVLSDGRVKEDPTTRKTRKETCKDRYKDRATEVVMNIIEMIGSHTLYGLDDEVRMQLTSRGYDEDSLDKGQMKIEKKKQWRESHGDQSPDELDSVACFCTMVLEKRIIVPGRNTIPEEDKYPGMVQWQRPDNKPKRLPKAARVSVAMRKR